MFELYSKRLRLIPLNAKYTLYKETESLYYWRFL